MGLAPYGADAFLRFQLRTKLRAIKEDDRRILWEGLDSLTTYEVREACQERGMSAYGLSDFEYKRQLREWLDLSIQKSIPISLLIMSRAFTLHQGEQGSVPSGDQLRDSLSSLDEEIINEVVIAAARPSEENTIDMKTRKLESLQFQQEMILEEREDTEDARQAAKQAEPAAAVSVSASAVDEKTPPAAPVEKEQKLSLNEMQALSDLVNPVEREKNELAELRSKNEEVTTSEANSSAGSEAAPEDKEFSRMKSLLDAMLAGISVKIDSTEVFIGDKLKLLDLDMDGELSVVELKMAIARILKRGASDAEAEELARLLDKDKDGKVSVSELMRFVEERRELAEVQELEAQVKKPMVESQPQQQQPQQSTTIGAESK